LRDNLVRPKVFLGELLGWAGHLDELSFNESLVTNLEVQRWSTISIGRGLITNLCFRDRFLELLVEFVQVHSKLLCTRGCNVAFGVYGEVWVITFVGKKGGNAGRGVRSIVVGKLRDGQEFGPIVLLVIAIDPEILLKGLVCPFGLSIAFWMITRGKVESHVQCFS
jgi:hypothetical protein